MMMKLTRRQTEFLTQFLKVFRETGEPVHYALLAGRLGIGNVTAYEMLRLLEKRGLVKSEYYLPDQDRGPGRSSVLFRPTPEANRLLQEGREDLAKDVDWEAAKEHILNQLRTGGAAELGDLLTSLLDRIPTQGSALFYLTDMITAILLALREIRDLVEDSGLASRLRRIGLPGEIELSSLAGVGAMLATLERVNRQVASFLLTQSGKFQTLLSQLDEEKRQSLSYFTREVVKILNA